MEKPNNSGWDLGWQVILNPKDPSFGRVCTSSTNDRETRIFKTNRHIRLTYLKLLL
jgi:hypothetical protein